MLNLAAADEKTALAAVLTCSFGKLPSCGSW